MWAELFHELDSELFKSVRVAWLSLFFCVNCGCGMTSWLRLLPCVFSAVTDCNMEE